MIKSLIIFKDLTKILEKFLTGLYHHKIRMSSQDIKTETDQFVALWIRCRSSNLEAWVRIRSGAQTFYFIYSLFSFNFDSSRCSHAGTKRYEFK